VLLFFQQVGFRFSNFNKLMAIVANVTNDYLLIIISALSDAFDLFVEIKRSYPGIGTIAALI
jgi:hypothetical protein